MKALFDRTFRRYLLLGLANYAFCSAVMLVLNIALSLSESASLLIAFLLQCAISFLLNRYVTFRGCEVSRLWPLFSAGIVALSYVLAKVLLRDLFFALLTLEGPRAACEGLRVLLRVSMEPTLFRQKLVMLLCTFTYSVINYFGQRYLVFRPDRQKQEEPL